ncbi:MAG: pentapeptide repeat-containing protein [Synechococcus sp.]
MKVFKIASFSAVCMVTAFTVSGQLVGAETTAIEETANPDLSQLSIDEALLYLSENGTCYRCQMSGASFIGATLQGTNLSKTDLTDANFNGAFLRQANLIGADLSGAVFINGYLARSNFREANLIGTDFSGSRLYDADLTNTNFSEANLKGVSLVRANLSGADLRTANLTNAYLMAITYDDTTQWPEGFTPPPSQ